MNSENLSTTPLSPSERARSEELVRQADQYAMRVILNTEKKLGMHISNNYHARQLIIQEIATAWAEGHLSGIRAAREIFK